MIQCVDHGTVASCESGPRSGDDGHKRERGNKMRLAVDALGHSLAVRATPANALKHR